SYSQPLTVKMDPRVKTPAAGLSQQFKLSQQLYNRLLTLSPAVEQAGDVRKQLKELQKSTQGDALAAVNGLDQKLQALTGGAARRPGAGTEPPTLAGTRTRYLALLNIFQEADVAPTAQAASAVGELDQQLPPLLERWQVIKSQDIPALNAQLKKAGLPEIKISAGLLLPKGAVSAKDKDEE